MSLRGLVLSGGLSSRMGRDKGGIVYPPSTLTQRARCFELLAPFCEKAYVSCRKEQRDSIEPGLPLVLDSREGGGPGVGILSAADLEPGHSWLVLACDFPLVVPEDIAELVAARSPAHDATCFAHRDGTLEPLFTIWEPAALEELARNFVAKEFGPRKALSSVRCKKLAPSHEAALLNVNSPIQI